MAFLTGKNTWVQYCSNHAMKQCADVLKLLPSDQQWYTMSEIRQSCEGTLSQFEQDGAYALESGDIEEYANSIANRYCGGGAEVISKNFSRVISRERTNGGEIKSSILGPTPPLIYTPATELPDWVVPTLEIAAVGVLAGIAVYTVPAWLPSLSLRVAAAGLTWLGTSSLF